ncbi:MAG: hypothetical protein ACLPXB_14120, partial [Thiobacillaceae bacterium]
APCRPPNRDSGLIPDPARGERLNGAILAPGGNASLEIMSFALGPLNTSPLNAAIFPGEGYQPVGYE